MQTKFSIFLNCCGKDLQIPHDIINLIISKVKEINSAYVWQVSFNENWRVFILRHVLGPCLMLEKILFSLNWKLSFYDQYYFGSHLIDNTHTQKFHDRAFKIFLDYLQFRIPDDCTIDQFTTVDCSIDNIRYLEFTRKMDYIDLLLPVLKMRNYIEIWKDLHTQRS